MISASSTDYNDLGIRESLDQQLVNLQNKTDLSFPLSDDLCLQRKMRSIAVKPREGRRNKRGLVRYSGAPGLLDKLYLILTAAVE